MKHLLLTTIAAVVLVGVGSRLKIFGKLHLTSQFTMLLR
jgi:hypothetical protein